MPDVTDDQALTAEFDVLASRAGLTIPEDRRPALLAGFKELRKLAALTRQPRTAADEPAGAYAILGVTRSLS